MVHAMVSSFHWLDSLRRTAIRFLFEEDSFTLFLNSPSITITVAIKPLCPGILGYAPPSLEGEKGGKGKRPGGENPFKAVLEVVDAVTKRLNRRVMNRLYVSILGCK